MRWIPRTTPLFVLFWLVLSGHVDALFLALGALSVVLVSWLSWRAGLAEGEGSTVRLIVRLPRYFVWLGKEVLMASVAVMRKVWAPQLAFRPVVKATPLPDMSVLGQVTYANSITLTPGTLALDVYDDEIKVHSLEAAQLESLRAGEMVRRVQRLEGHR